MANKSNQSGLSPTKGNSLPYIERDCVFEHQGKKFESGGAVATANYLIAYPDKNGRLNNWHGEQIGTYRIISSRPAIFFGYRSWQGERFYFMRATAARNIYSLRGFGIGMIAKGKAIK